MSEVRRVAIVQRDVNLSGSLEREVYLLVRELVRLGLDVHVYCNPDTRAPGLDGVTFHDVRPMVRSTSRVGRALELASFAAAATKAVRDDRRRYAYDIVDVNGFAGWGQDIVRVHEVVRAAQARWPREAGRTRRFARLRAAAAPLLRPQMAVARSVQSRQFASPRGVFALADAERVRDDILGQFGVPPGQVDVVPLTFDAAEIGVVPDGTVRAAYGIRADEPLLLFVGHAFRRKGLAHAIEALAGLPGAHLVVVGGGEDGETVATAERRAREAGVGARVHFAGSQQAVARYYAAADLLVLPTSHEPWGIPVVEAMAAGIPVVTTQVAGSAELLERAGAGIVVDEADPATLRDAVRSLLANPARRAEMGARGRVAASSFVPAVIAERTLAAYERALAVRSRRLPRRAWAVGPATSRAIPLRARRRPGGWNRLRSRGGP